MLQALQIIQNYDYVLIDTRGAYGVLVENAVLAVNKEEVGILKTIIPNRVVYCEAATLQIPVRELESKRCGGISAKKTIEKLMAEQW